jgi:hypothetical protein
MPWLTAAHPAGPGFDLGAPLSTDQDIIHRVDRLLDQDSRRHRSLWLLFLSGDGVQLPVMVPIDDAPAQPDSLLAGNLCWVIAHVLGDAAGAGSAVVTLTRPGEETMNDSDREWFRALHAAARERGAAIRMICLATRAGVRQLTFDQAG